MYIDLTPELRALRDELRGYFAKLMTTELVAELSAGGEGGGPEYRTALAEDGPRRLARDRLAQGVRRPGPLADRAVPLRRRGAARRLPAALPHARHRRPDAHGATATPSRRRSFLPRILRGELHFAIGYSEPGAGTDLAVAHDQRRARRRRVGDQRAEDLHEPRRTTPTTSGSPRAPIPTRRSTAASRSSSSRPRRPASS